MFVEESENDRAKEGDRLIEWDVQRVFIVFLFSDTVRGLLSGERE